MNTPATPDETSLTREMGTSHAEFFRILPRAVAGQPYTVEGDTVILAGDTRQVRIILSPQGERVLASVRLPTTLVEFRFRGYARDEVEQFMSRFDLYFHRGGG